MRTQRQQQNKQRITLWVTIYSTCLWNVVRARNSWMDGVESLLIKQKSVAREIKVLSIKKSILQFSLDCAFWIITMKFPFEFVLIFMLLLKCFQVNSQVLCFWVYPMPQPPQNSAPDNTGIDLPTSTEPNLANIFFAPEICPRGFMPIHGRCRQVNSQY